MMSAALHAASYLYIQPSQDSRESFVLYPRREYVNHQRMQILGSADVPLCVSMVCAR
jgi:hypothetical protein